MELKELVLSTLQELDEKIENERRYKSLKESLEEEKEGEKFQGKREPGSLLEDEELRFLKHTKERLLVLFEGLKAEEIRSYEEKLDLTLRYLQLLLAQIEQRLMEKTTR